MYFSQTHGVDRDLIIGSAFYHDAMKTVVFQWNEDGTLFEELTIAGTGAHHILSGAQAILQKRSARFVITLLSAHAAPSLGDETKVVDWCRAASIVAGVDPVAYGLVRRNGSAFSLACDFVPIEAFISHLSDHDYVFSVHATHVVRAELEGLRARHGSRDAWFLNTVLARESAIGLYRLLASQGRKAFTARVDSVYAQS